MGPKDFIKVIYIIDYKLNHTDMKKLIENIGLTLLIASCAFIVIVILIDMSDGSYVDVDHAIIMGDTPEVGSYDSAIDGKVTVDSSFHKLLLWYHDQGVETDSRMLEYDMQETANALDIPRDSVTYKLNLEYMECANHDEVIDLLLRIHGGN